MTLNTKTNTFSLSGTIQSGSKTAESGSFKVDIAPSSKPVTVVAPTGAKSIIQLFTDLGLPTTLSGLGASYNIPTTSTTQTF